MLLTRQETAVMRGLAIMLIILHNFCHWWPDCVPENEYTWSPDNIDLYFACIRQGGPHLFLNFLSHYGHYGVTVFLFLSGYGLTLKYDKLQQLDPITFLMDHAKKLWKLLLPSIVLFYILVQIRRGQPRAWDDIISLLTFTANIDPRHPFMFGPWWWFSLMMEFYVIYRIFFYHRSNRTISIFTLACLGVQLALTIYYYNDLSNDHNLLGYLHYNFPCTILPFTLGVFCARQKLDWAFSEWMIVPSVAIVLLGSFSAWAWCVAQPFAAIALIQLGKVMSKPRVLSATFAWIGGISAWIFALHPVVRHFSMRYLSTHSEYLVLIGYLAVTFLFSLGMQWLTKKIKL